MATTVVAYRTDWPYRMASANSRMHPIAVGMIYFLFSYVFLWLLILLTGGLGAVRSTPRYLLLVDNISLGLLGPIGAAALCHFYRTIQWSFTALLTGTVIPHSQHNSYHELLGRLDRLYNNRIVTVGCLFTAILLSGLNYWAKPGTWLGARGEIAPLYARLFIALNFYILFVITYKCGVTTWGIRQVFNYSVNVQPMHPDKCGGLKAIGALSLAMHYFVSIAMIYIALLMVLDPMPRQYPVYIVVYLLAYITGPVLLFASMSKANRYMSSRKQQELERINQAFSEHYTQSSDPGKVELLTNESAKIIPAIHDLYQIVARMPVWPFDVASITRFVSTYAIPALMFVADALLNQKSVFWQLLTLLQSVQSP